MSLNISSLVNFPDFTEKHRMDGFAYSKRPSNIGMEQKKYLIDYGSELNKFHIRNQKPPADKKKLTPEQLFLKLVDDPEGVLGHLTDSDKHLLKQWAPLHERLAEWKCQTDSINEGKHSSLLKTAEAIENIITMTDFVNTANDLSSWGLGCVVDLLGIYEQGKIIDGEKIEIQELREAIKNGLEIPKDKESDIPDLKTTHPEVYQTISIYLKQILVTATLSHQKHLKLQENFQKFKKVAAIGGGTELGLQIATTVALESIAAIVPGLNVAVFASRIGGHAYFESKLNGFDSSEEEVERRETILSEGSQLITYLDSLADNQQIYPKTLSSIKQSVRKALSFMKSDLLTYSEIKIRHDLKEAIDNARAQRIDEQVGEAAYMATVSMY